MTLRFPALLCLVLLLCNPGGAVAQGTTIAGWGNWRFNQTLDEALANSGPMQWNSYSLSACRDNIEVDGYLLSTYGGPSLPPVDVIPLRPLLRFDKHGRLSEINLWYERGGKITQSQCLDIFGRLLDWQVATTGVFYSDDKPQAASDTAAGWVRVSAHTPGGTAYSYGRSVPKKADVTSFLRWPNDSRSQPNASIMSAFVTVGGKPNCHVTISFSRDRD
jgi:hypothetical protein